MFSLSFSILWVSKTRDYEYENALTVLEMQWFENILVVGKGTKALVVLRGIFGAFAKERLE